MDREELFDRLRQFATARADLLLNGRLQQFASQTVAGREPRYGRFFFDAVEIPLVCKALKQILPAQANDILSRADRICRHRFDLLAYDDLDFGPEIDWHLDPVHAKRAPLKPWFRVKYLDFDEIGDSKITWELNRHQHFVALAKAYLLAGDEKFVREIFQQWAHWRNCNPYPIGINWASSLEVAYRSLSWIWTFFLLQDCTLFTPGLRRQWHDALGLNGRHIETYLSTYFSPNTHLLGEALALFFLGTLFPTLRAAGRWQRRGWEILQREAEKQVRSDGFYFEQSTYYHVYATDIFLHARILAEQNGISVSAKFDQTLQKMLHALAQLGRAGIPPMLGDDDGGRLFDGARNRVEHMLDSLATGAVLYHRGDFKSASGGLREETLWLLGAKAIAEFDSLPVVPPVATSAAFRESGFYLMADEDSRQQLLIDAGPLGAGSGGHGHADALSISLVRSGQNVLLDPGTLEYIGPGAGRARLRGTGAHSTLQVDGQDQAEATGPFSWKTFPQVAVEQWITGRQFDLFRGSHDGYARLPSPVIHRRWVFHKKGDFYLVRDLAEGSASHQLDIAWRIGPDFSPDASRPGLFTSAQGALALLTAEGHGWSQSVRSEVWSPAYGRAARAPLVQFESVTQLPVDFVTLLIANENVQSDCGDLRRMNEFASNSVCGYGYSNSQQLHTIFFAPVSKPWSLALWASDAELLYCGFDRKKEQCTLVLCNGSYADIGGNHALTSKERVSYAEVLSSPAKVEMFSSDPQQVALSPRIYQMCADAAISARADDPTRTGV